MLRNHVVGVGVGSDVALDLLLDLGVRPDVTLHLLLDHGVTYADTKLGQLLNLEVGACNNNKRILVWQ